MPLASGKPKPNRPFEAVAAVEFWPWLAERLALMRKASAALVAPSGKLDREERDELERKFVRVHQYESFAVYLLR